MDFADYPTDLVESIHEDLLNMRPNERNRKELTKLGFTWDYYGEHQDGSGRLFIRLGGKWICFTGANYQDELSAYLLGWATASDES